MCQKCAKSRTAPPAARSGGHLASMGRPPRNEYEHGYYHVHTRGNNKQPVYLDDLDRHVFLQLLERSQVKYEWVIFEWCLMTTHYHFVLRIGENGLAQGMSELNGSYARWSNGRHGRCDHVFGKRYTSNEITTDAYLLGACRYVVLNPVRAGLCSHPREWRWSSYRASAGLEPPRRFHARDVLLGHVRELFATPTSDGHAVYRAFIEAGLYAAGPDPVPGTVPGV
jgi:REP element-mobilizing transposase RayT